VTENDEKFFAQDIGERLAAGWERYRAEVFTMTRGASDWLVAQADPQPGQRVLELTAGPGETGFLVAERIGPEGTLLSTDVSPAMVDAARRGAEARGLGNVEPRVMDAQQVELPDASVDAVISRFGVMLVPEPARVAAEAKRVLRPGGRFAYVAWGPPDRNPWLLQLVGAVMSQGHTLEGNPFGPGGPFSLAAPEANLELMAGGGFSDVAVEEIEGAMAFPDVDAYWELQLAVSGPIALLIQSLADAEQQAVRAALDASIEPFVTDEGPSLPWQAVGVSGTA
jgi:SAM-dependent methyltransferase